jgi:hypothetical protein
MGVIEQMQAKITELEAKVELLEKGNSQGIYKTLIANLKDSDQQDVGQEPPMTLQQFRDRAVERAKEAIVELMRDKNRGWYRITHKNMTILCRANFYVNTEKRVVTAVLEGAYTRNKYARGIAKCNQDDCFNVHIGKAIALYRALGLKVPSELLRAPQPEEVHIGDIVQSVEFGYTEKVVRLGLGRMYYLSGEFDRISDLTDKKQIVVIDDSREGVSAIDNE